MWWHWQCSVIVILLSAACYGSESVSEGDYPLEDERQSTCAQKECARCDLATGRCLRCLYAIVEHTRHCTDLCPVGHVPTWRDDYDYQGTVCSPRSLLAAITGRDIAVIACAAAGGAVCVGIILGAIIYARRHAALKPALEEASASKIPVPRLWKDPRPSAADVSVTAEERKEFLQSLSGLRKDVPLLLEMLAETRARFRGISGPENSMDTKARAYRAVVRDLSRVVSLVARRDDSFQAVPSDWRRLFEWADRVLTRYRRTRDSKCTGCQHHGTCELKLEEMNKVDSSTTQTTGAPSQPLFQTRQQAQEARWRQQRKEGAKFTVEPQAKLYWSDADFTSTCDSRSRCSGDEIEVDPASANLNSEDPDESTTADLEQEAERSKELSIAQIPSVDANDIEISYSKDEEALAHQKALFSILDENLKQDFKTSNVNFDVGENKIKKERGSPGMITRIFCNRLINNSDITFPANNDDIQKQQPSHDHNISKEIECLSSNSIYDHIEAFTFEDFSVSQKVEGKNVNSKSKQKNTANVNVHRLRKPNFPGYSESFKQILDKKNLLNLQKNKIQKRLSKKGEQLNKMVRRTESRFLKDRSKMNPNLTYDRRNCKTDVVNETMVGGDVYVNVVKQPVVERCRVEESVTYQNFEDLEESDEIVNNVSTQPAESEFTEINIDDGDKHVTANIRCEILTDV